MAVTQHSADGTEKLLDGTADIRMRGFLFRGGVKVSHLNRLLHRPDRPLLDTVRLTFGDGEWYDVKFNSQLKAAAFENECAGFFVDRQSKAATNPYAFTKKESLGSVEPTRPSPQKREAKNAYMDDFMASSNVDLLSGNSKRLRTEDSTGMTPPPSEPDWLKNVNISTPDKISMRLPAMRRAPARPTTGMLISGMRKHTAPQSSSVYNGYRSAVSFGLQNLGNTCYLNAVLQAIGSLKNFVADLQSMVKSMPALEKGELYRHSVEILQQMGTTATSSGPLNPSKLRERVGRISPMFKSGGQQDAHEFLLEYINQLHDELLEARKSCSIPEAMLCEDIVPLATQSHLDSEVEKTLACVGCQKSRVVTEPFRDFSLDFGIPTSTNGGGDRCFLASMLKSYFSGELLEAKCESCGEPAAFMQKQMTTRPNVLILHLKRFVPNWEKRRYDKQHQFVDIPTRLDLHGWGCESTSENGSSSARLPARPLANGEARVDGDLEAIGESSGPPQGNTAYILRAIVAHDGSSPQSGHYVCYTRSDTGAWRLYDDSSVKECGNGRYQNELGRKAYIVFYVLQSPDADSPSTSSVA